MLRDTSRISSSLATMLMLSWWHEDTAAHVVIPLPINIAAILAVFARLFPGLFEDRPVVSNNLFSLEFDREAKGRVVDVDFC